MAISRAEFLKKCSLAVLGVSVAGGTELRRVVLRSFTFSRQFHLGDASALLFRRYLRQAFDVRTDSGRKSRLVLARVDERHLSAEDEQFSLIFHGSADAAVPDGTHTFQHPALGRFELFIVPFGSPGGSRVTYEACFGRRRARPATA